MYRWPLIKPWFVFYIMSYYFVLCMKYDVLVEFHRSYGASMVGVLTDIITHLFSLGRLWNDAPRNMDEKQTWNFS
jgi:hypothetical protein